MHHKQSLSNFEIIYKNQMLATTVARLLFFGSRYFSLLFVARLLEAEAAEFLLSVVTVEIFRIVFDYGLENNILARAHQKTGRSGDLFRLGKGNIRLSATLIGQLFTTLVIALICNYKAISMTLPLVTSLQFCCLMGFGYLQAHLQTSQINGMSSLIRPLILATILQGALLALAQHGVISVWVPTISFEFFAFLACLYTLRKVRRAVDACGTKNNVASPSSVLVACQSVLSHIAPIGNVALIGLAYSRLDAIAVSLVSGGALLSQYLFYQRLASAPLMFFSTIASASISTLSDARHNTEIWSKKMSRYRQSAYLMAALSGAIFYVGSPLIGEFFTVTVSNYRLLVLQCFLLALQIANGFHASLLIALEKSQQLWQITRNNALVAIVLLPLGAWNLEAIGVMLALCLIEIFCATQHVVAFHAQPLADPLSHD